MEKLSVAIADDNEIMLQLLGDIIESDDELNVVGTAKDGEEAYRVIKTKEKVSASSLQIQVTIILVPVRQRLFKCKWYKYWTTQCLWCNT